MPERIKSFNPFAGVQVKAVRAKRLITEDRREDQLFYRTARWRRCRLMKLRINPVCQCEDHCRQPATEVHHIIDRRERPDLSYDMDNLQSLTKSCHSKITRQRQINNGRKNEL